MKILLIAYELEPPWDNGLKVYGKGLMSSLQNIKGASVDAIYDLSDMKRNNGNTRLHDSYDFVHIVLTGLEPIRKSLSEFQVATIFKHIVTPSVGFRNAIATKMAYSLLRRSNRDNRLIKCFSSEFVAQSYFMDGGTIVPPCVDTLSFDKPGAASTAVRHDYNEIHSILESSTMKFGIDNLQKNSSDMPLIFYSGPLTEDRFPFRKVLSALQSSKFKMLIIGRPANNGSGIQKINEVVAYANKLGIEDRVSVALKVLSEQEKIILLNYADIVIQPFAKSSYLYVAVDPPIFLLEAMSCEKPVITSKAYSFQSFIKNGHNGYTVDWDDQAAVDAVLDECQIQKTRNELGANARKTVINNFSLKSVSETLLRLYNNDNN